MKKLLSLIALLMSLLFVLPAMAENAAVTASSFSAFDFFGSETETEADSGDDSEEALIARNTQFVQDFLDSREYTYEKKKDNVFVLDFSIDGAYDDAELWLTVYAAGVQCEVTCDVIVPDDVMAELCRYAMYVNSTQRVTLFYLDSGNELWSVNFCQTQNDGMDEDDFAFYYTSALSRWEEFSQGFEEIIENGKTAEELMK